MSEDEDSDLPDTPNFDDMRAVRRRVRENKAKAERELNSKKSFSAADIEAYDRYELGQTARELRRQERLISGIERILTKREAEAAKAEAASTAKASSS